MQLKIKFIILIFQIFLIYSCAPSANEGSKIINEILKSEPLFNKGIKPCIFNRGKTFKDAEPPLIPMDIKPIPPFDSTPCVYQLISRNYFENDIKKSVYCILIKNDYFVDFFLNQLNEKERNMAKKYLDEEYGFLDYELDTKCLDISDFFKVCLKEKEIDISKLNRRTGVEIIEISKIYINKDKNKAVVGIFTDRSGGYLYYLLKIGKNWYVSVIEEL